MKTILVFFSLVVGIVTVYSKENVSEFSKVTYGSKTIELWTKIQDMFLDSFYKDETKQYFLEVYDDKTEGLLDVAETFFGGDFIGAFTKAEDAEEKALTQSIGFIAICAAIPFLFYCFGCLGLCICPAFQKSWTFQFYTGLGALLSLIALVLGWQLEIAVRDMTFAASGVMNFANVIADNHWAIQKEVGYGSYAELPYDPLNGMDMKDLMKIEIFELNFIFVEDIQYFTPFFMCPFLLCLMVLFIKCGNGGFCGRIVHLFSIIFVCVSIIVLLFCGWVAFPLCIEGETDGVMQHLGVSDYHLEYYRNCVAGTMGTYNYTDFSATMKNVPFYSMPSTHDDFDAAVKCNMTIDGVIGVTDIDGVIATLTALNAPTSTQCVKDITELFYFHLIAADAGECFALDPKMPVAYCADANAVLTYAHAVILRDALDADNSTVTMDTMVTYFEGKLSAVDQADDDSFLICQNLFDSDDSTLVTHLDNLQDVSCNRVIPLLFIMPFFLVIFFTFLELIMCLSCCCGSTKSSSSEDDYNEPRQASEDGDRRSRGRTRRRRRN